MERYESVGIYLQVSCIRVDQTKSQVECSLLGHGILDEGKCGDLPTGNTRASEARCYHRIEGNEAAGHVPGDAATCTQPQLCTKCGAVLKNALGHDYKSKVTAPNHYGR